jgi:CHAD domain-containing protein
MVEKRRLHLGARHIGMFQFDVKEPLEREIRRVILDELEDADDALAGGDEPLSARVHEARKRLKRLRAVLALVEDNGREQALSTIAENTRAAAHSLAGPRGHVALLQCFDDLVQKNPDGASEELKALLTARVQRATLEASDYLEQAREKLRDARGAAKELDLNADGFSFIADGFCKTYRKARRALGVARAQGSSADFHAFRKPSKRHFHQLRLLEATWPELLRSQAGEVDDLAELLGEHHDLCLLSVELARLAPREPERELSRAIARRRRELESDVLARGARCFSERPSAITRRVGGYYALTKR